MELNLSGKKALITGGSMGIGLETARCLAREGAEVMICARRESALAEAAADIKRTTGRIIHVHQLDVTNLEQIAALPAAIESKLGGVDLLVNNAGTGIYKPFLEVTDEELQYATAINFFAPYRISQKVIPFMLQRGGGHIINISGATGIMVMSAPFLSTCAGPAKAAEVRFSKILANEFADRNIRVNCIVPGLVNTPEHVGKWERDFAKRQVAANEGEEVRGKWAAEQGMRNTRWGTPEELANLIVFTLSDAAAYVNGAVIVADGGLDKS